MTDTEIICEALNKLVMIDRAAMQELFDTRVLISEHVVAGCDFPFVVGGAAPNLTLGPLGLINGIVEFTRAGKIAAEYGGDGSLLRFVVVTP